MKNKMKMLGARRDSGRHSARNEADLRILGNIVINRKSFANALPKTPANLGAGPNSVLPLVQMTSGTAPAYSIGSGRIHLQKFGASRPRLLFWLPFVLEYEAGSASNT